MPAEGLLKIQVLEGLVSLICGGHVHESQTDAGHDLEHETKQRAAAEDIKPAACAGGHRVTCGRFEELADMQSVIDPKGDFSQHSRFLFFLPCQATETFCKLLKRISEA